MLQLSITGMTAGRNQMYMIFDIADDEKCCVVVLFDLYYYNDSHIFSFAPHSSVHQRPAA